MPPEWKDNLQPASFRGVPFFVRDSNFSGGRKKIEHNFLNKDLPSFEDVGRLARKFSIEGYLLGDDYNLQRDALIAALEDKAIIGTLVHHYYGNIQVSSGIFTVGENEKEGGFATVSMDFTQAVELDNPLFKDSANNLIDASQKTIEIVQEDFDAVFTVAALPGFVKASASAIVSGMSAAMDGAKVFLKDVESVVVQDRAQLDSLIASLDANSSILIASANNISSAIIEIYDTLDNASTIAQEIFDFCFSVFEFGDNVDDPPQTTTTRAKQKLNDDKLIEIMKGVAVSKAARASATISFTSQEEAKNIRDTIITQIDLIIESTDSDTIFQQMRILKAEVSKFLDSGQEDTAEIINIQLNGSESSLVLAWELYKDAEEETDILNRNVILHPSFLPSDKILEVLTSV